MSTASEVLLGDYRNQNWRESCMAQLSFCYNRNEQALEITIPNDISNAKKNIYKRAIERMFAIIQNMDTSFI